MVCRSFLLRSGCKSHSGPIPDSSAKHMKEEIKSWNPDFQIIRRAITDFYNERITSKELEEVIIFFINAKLRED